MNIYLIKFVLTVINQDLLFLFIQNQINEDKNTMTMNKVNEMMTIMKEPERLQQKYT